MVSVLKLYSDTRYLPAGQPHITPLFPFWGKTPEDPEDPVSGRFDAYVQEGRRFFDMTEPEEADFFVLPGWWNAGGPNPLVYEMSAAASAAGKPLLIFFNGDSEEDIPVGGSLVFRTSCRRSFHRPREFAMPAWSEDFVERYLGRVLPVRSKSLKPVVGYCGYAAQATRPGRHLRLLRRMPGLARLLRRLRFGTNGSAGMQRRSEAAAKRSEAVARLRADKRIGTNFLLRAAFWNGSVTPAAMRQSRMEFVENMVGSDYILCLRGAGNFSYRLYETLSCGRIPVFVDTDCVLPYERWIDWRRHCIWVEEKDLPHIAERVAEFHDTLTEQEFQNRQRACRRLWEQWLSPVGYFANFYRHFERNSSV